MPQAVAVPLGAAAIGAAASMWGANKNANAQDKAAREQANLYNNWLAQRNNTAQDILSKIRAGGYDPFSKQVLESGGSSSTNTYQKSNPFITEDYKPLEGMMRGILENRLSRGSSLPPGYEANAIRTANASFDGARAAASNLAARKGLSAQQLFATATPFEAQRAGKIADIRANTPLLERQMLNEDLGAASGAISNFGKGTESRTRSNTNFSNWAEQLPDLNTLANFFMPAGPQQSTVSPFSAGGSALSSFGSSALGLAGLLGQMYANGTLGGGTGGGVPAGVVPANIGAQTSSTLYPG